MMYSVDIAIEKQNVNIFIKMLNYIFNVHLNVWMFLNILLFEFFSINPLLSPSKINET